MSARSVPPRESSVGRAQPTISDVAELAGVSKSTVSNVIRGAAHVSPATRRRVLQAITTVGYRPNALARNLVRRRTTTVGIVVGDLTNPFYSELAKLIEQRLSDSGYASMICNTDGQPPKEMARVGSLIEHRVAGVLMFQFSGDSTVLDILSIQRVPVVLVSCRDESTDSVTIDETLGAALATRHLLDLGHRCVAYVSSALVEPPTDRARFDGYRRALGEANLERDAEHVLRWEHPANLRSAGDFRGRLERLLAGPAPPTGFFASNDLLAIDLIEALEEIGLQVPSDASVVGFDDIAIAGLHRVSLTTVAQPREELARIGLDILIDRIDGIGSLGPQQIRLAPTLVTRGSTAAPAAVEGGR